MSIKRKARDVSAGLLSLTGITAPGRRHRGCLSIATFHRVLPQRERLRYPYPGLVVTPQELEAFLSYFSEHFDCGTLSAQYERHLSGEAPERPLLALTFDDAQYDNFRYARPLLDRYRAKASFFVPVAAVERRELLWHDRLGFAVLALLEQPKGGWEGLERIAGAASITLSDRRAPAQDIVRQSKRLPLGARLQLVDAMESVAGTCPPEFARLMSFEELATLAAEGHEIGSHSMTHCMMPECDDGALNYELTESRKVLRERIAQPIDSFCYPNGDADTRTAQAVASAGYRRAVTTAWGRNGRGADRFRLRRYHVDAERVRDSNGRFMPALLAFRMSGFFPGLG